MLNDTIKKVTLIEDIEDDLQLMRVDLANSDYMLMYGSYADTIQYIGKSVVVKATKNIYKGNYENFIDTLSVITKVATIDRSKDFKLYISNLPDIGCSIDFSELEVGSCKKGAILYVQNAIYNSSFKSDWFEYLVLDKRRKSLVMRLFEPEGKLDKSVIGHFVNCDIRFTRYGLVTDKVIKLDKASVEPNQELELSKCYILKTINDDTELLQFVESTNLLNAMVLNTYEDIYEGGFCITELAQELDIANEFKNITEKIDIRAIKRALVIFNAYKLSYNSESIYPKHLLNLKAIEGTSLDKDTLLLKILVEGTSYNCLERDVAHHIVQLIQSVTRYNKTLVLERNKL